MLGLWLCCVSPDIKHQCQGILMKSSVRHHWSSSTSALSKDKVGHREWSSTASFRGDNLHFIYGHFARHPSMVSCELFIPYFARQVQSCTALMAHPIPREASLMTSNTKLLSTPALQVHDTTCSRPISSAIVCPFAQGLSETEESIGLMTRGAREVNINLKYAINHVIENCEYQDIPRSTDL
ncbi:hypothetical protein RRG08_017823 [Elysia crispata]|uniref:Uncharacterized protein n=1 Tax=Elysia crispata TaxID=231223 RepID=A0AAE1B790_9GAST|nr:hypothetical protein RRG08_017823 [Elysia crispata]